MRQKSTVNSRNLLLILFALLRWTPILRQSRIWTRKIPAFNVSNATVYPSVNLCDDSHVFTWRGCITHPIEVHHVGDKGYNRFRIPEFRVVDLSKWTNILRDGRGKQHIVGLCSLHGLSGKSCDPPVCHEACPDRCLERRIFSLLLGLFLSQDIVS
ncbi:hypothetical protein C8J56DRAFT_954107 [Mycena floridula]|nr:hypothetical protein C8J56DRAFT_954107 [Mycena floridula]